MVREGGTDSYTFFEGEAGGISLGGQQHSGLYFITENIIRFV